MHVLLPLAAIVFPGAYLVGNTWKGKRICLSSRPMRGFNAFVYQGVVKVGAVNCDNEDLESICKDAGVSGYPTIKWFQKGKDQGAYRGNRKGAEIVAWGLELLPNLVAQITSKAELDDVMGRCSGRGKSRASWSLCVLLFTEKKDTSPMLKSLAMQVR